MKGSADAPVGEAGGRRSSRGRGEVGRPVGCSADGSEPRELARGARCCSRREAGRGPALGPARGPCRLRSFIARRCSLLPGDLKTPFPTPTFPVRTPLAPQKRDQPLEERGLGAPVRPTGRRVPYFLVPVLSESNLLGLWVPPALGTSFLSCLFFVWGWGRMAHFLLLGGERSYLLRVWEPIPSCLPKFLILKLPYLEEDSALFSERAANTKPAMITVGLSFQCARLRIKRFAFIS